MHKLILICMLFLVGHLMAQENIPQLHSEIDQQVWRPFQKAFEALDAEKLNALYAENVLRVTPQGIDTRNKFKGQNLQRFKENKENGTKINLDFWFDSRKTTTDTSYEVGFYRIRFLTKGKESIVYGQFHIVLKRINNYWKITQDWDTTFINGNEITAKDFAKNTPISF